MSWGTANFVYHERSGEEVTQGATPTTCAAGLAYAPVLNPNSAQAYLLRFKVEYQFGTDQLRVYYTTDGSAPNGAFGTPSGTTQVVNGNYDCTFTVGGNVIDVCSATIPAQPAGTVVKYIISAWHSGGGDEVFANSGTCCPPYYNESSDVPNPFQYTVVSATDLYWDSNGNVAGAGGATPTGTWGSDNFWSAMPNGTLATGAWIAGRNAVFAAGTDASGSYTVTVSGNQSATGVRVEEGNVTLFGGTTTLSGAAGIDVVSGSTLTWSNVIAGSAGWTKSGPGTMLLRAHSTATGTRNILSGVVSIDTSLRIPGSDNVTLNGGTLRQTNPSNGGSFINAATALIVGPNGGTVDYTSSGAGTVSIYAGTITGSGNTLTKTGPNEFRYQGTGLPNTTFGKLVVNQGLFRLGFNSSTADERGFGEVPSSFTADAITLNGGSVGVSFNITNHPNRGITLGPNGGGFICAGNLTLIAPITGSGSLGISNGSTISVTANGPLTYTGDTLADSGIFTINSANTLPGALRVRVGRVILNNQNIFSSISVTGRLDVNTNFCLGTLPIPLYSGAVLINSTTLGTGSLTNVTLNNDITLISTFPTAHIVLGAEEGRELILNGKVSGDSNWECDNVSSRGALVLANASNDYSGTGRVEVLTTVVVAANNALGLPTAGTVVESGGSLVFRGGINYTPLEPISMRGTGRGDSTGAISNQSGNSSFSGPITLLGTSGVGAADGTTLTLNGQITEQGLPDVTYTLYKLGHGTVALTANNLYTGGTIISNGVLHVANTTGSATGPGPITIQPGGALRGPGSVAGTVTIDGVISPGASPGTQNTGSEIWNGGGTYIWEINDVDATAGADPGWDLINITGGLTINATLGNKFNIKITSLTPANAAGDVADFNNTLEYTWTILKTTTGISGFDVAAFNLDLSGFSNPLGNGGFTIQTANGGLDLVLKFGQKPTITQAPAGGMAECGGTFTFQAIATGSEPLTFQYKHAGTNYGAPAVQPSGALTDFAVVASPGTAGSWVLEVSNAYGVATSPAATLTVVDTTAPGIACPADVTAECTSPAGAAVTYSAATATDVCDPAPAVMCSPASGSTFAPGTNMVTCTATDASMNTSNCTFKVIVRDTTAPDVTCPADVTVECTNATGTVAFYGVPVATDACSPMDIELECVPASGSTFPLGTNSVTCSAIDAAGNSNGCLIKIIVQDTTAPAIVCPTNTIAACGATAPGTTGSATATDGCDATPTVSHADGAPVIVTTATPNGWALSTTDGGTPPNTATAEYVTNAATPPLGLGSARLAVGANGAGAAQLRSATYAGVLLSDLTELRYSTFRTMDGSGGQMPYIMLNVDLDGNGSSDDLLFFEPEYQKPIYNPALPDQGALLTGAWQQWNALAGGWWSLNGLAGAAPGAGVKSLSTYIAANPTAKIATTAAGALRLLAGFGAGAWDNFDGKVDGVVVGTNGVSTAYDFELNAPCGPADIARVWRATDDSGNEATCTQLINVADTTAPTITCAPVVACTAGTTATVTFAPTVSDDCDAAPTVVCTPASGTEFMLGETMVTCVATDDCGNTNGCAFTVTVRQETTATALANVTVCPGEPATFGPVTASGTGPHTFVWRKDGGAPLAETGNTLTIAAATGADAGTYSVEVSGACNTVTNSATLTVNVLTAASGPANVNNACPGSTVALTTTPSGTGPFTFVWRKDGGAPLAETSGTLTLAMVSEADAGMYCVEVTGECNSVTNCATATIAPVPTITAHPQNFNGVQGNSATFMVTATPSSPALSYQWRYNGVNLSNGGQVSGATSATLTLSSLNCTNEGSFEVVVSNCTGSMTSQVAVLSVRPISAVHFAWETIGQFTNNVPNNGGSDPVNPLIFEVNSGGVGGGRALDMVASGTLSDSSFTAMPYDFSQNGNVLRASIMFKHKAGANNVNDTEMMLGFASKTSRLDGGDENVAFAAVQVLGQGASSSAPATGYQIRLRHKLFNGTTVNSVNASGNTALTVGTWYRLSINFTNIKATTANSFAYSGRLESMGTDGLAAPTLVHNIGSTVANADLVNDTSVFFDFRYRENAGNDLIDNLSIWTKDGPVFFACQPRSQTVLEGRPATITAYIDGTPPYTYQWLKGGSPIPGATDWRYVIRQATAMDAGDYRFVVNGTLMSDVATLTVTPDTFAPVLVSAGSFDGCSIGVCFDEPVDPVTATAPGNYTVTGATVGAVQLRPDGMSVVLLLSPTISGSFSVTVNNVKDRYNNTIAPGSMASGTVASHLTSIDIGNTIAQPLGPPLPPGSIYTCNDGDFDITAGGADVWGTSDQFRFTYAPREGDFDVRVKIANQTIPNTVLKAGLMVRETIDSASRTLHAIVNPPFPALERYETGQRTTYGGATASWGVGFNNGNRFTTPPNSWVRLRRVNDTFTAYAGSNGTDWVLIAQTTQDYPDAVLLGLEMTSHVQGRAGMTEFRSYGDFGGYPGAVITITSHPANATVTAGGATNFVVAATVTGAPTSELQYQWQRSTDGGTTFNNIQGANAASATFTTGPLFALDNGALYRVVLRVTGAPEVTSSAATLTVTDAAAPTITAVSSPAGSLSNVVVVFNEPVSAGTANVAGNYSISNAAGTVFTVASAVFHGNASTIVLSTDAVLPPGHYFLVVNGVTDLSGNAIAADTVRTFAHSAAPAQQVVVELYGNITGSDLVALTNLMANAKFANRNPDFLLYSNVFGHQTSFADSGLNNYGARVYTHFIAPSNGLYKFWMRSDDSSHLYMNTNPVASTVRLGATVIGSSANTPLGEVAANAIDDTVGTKYLNFDEVNTGFTVTPAQGATIVTGLRFTSANDAPERDPMTFTLEGTTGSPTSGPWTTIATGNTGLSTTRFATAADVTFANSTAYTSYRLTFPTVRDATAANSMQIAEVAFLDATGADVTKGRSFLGSLSAATANYTLVAQNVPLVGGQVYYLEALMKEGTGGDGISVTVRAQSDGGTPPNTEFLSGTLLAYPGNEAPATPIISELFTGFSGSDLPSLALALTSVKFPGNPDVVNFERNFGHNQDLSNSGLDNYLGRLYSYFVAPSNGLYKFWIRSDDASQLFMNTNAVNSTDPGGVVLLGQLGGFTGNYTLVAQNVPLTSGQRYYIEARYKEGTGGDGFSMAVRAQDDGATPPNTEVAPGSLFELPAVKVGAVGLAGISPASPSVSEGQTITFSAAGLTGATPTFRWFRNGAFLTANATYTTPPLTPSDNGAVYTLVLSNSFSTATASTAVTVVSDTTPAAIVSVSSHSYLTNVIVTFSEPLKPQSAANAGNYQIAGLTVHGAYLDGSLRRVSLHTSPQTPGAPYTLMVSGLLDASESGNPTMASVPFTAWKATGCEVGVLQAELFTNITGTAIANLTSEPRFVNNLVDSFSTLRTFQWTSVPPLTGNGLENYGVRISGYFIPPSNGVYRFYIRSDDASQLFMNTNAMNSTDPAGKVLIAREDTCCKAYGDVTAGGPRVSPGIDLAAGQPYYIEALLKEGGGGDFFQMAFREAGDPSTPPNYETASGEFFALPPNPVDTTAPHIVRTYSLSGRSVVLEFSETINSSRDLGANTTFDPFNFSVEDGVSMAQFPTAATLRADGRSILLDLANPLMASSYSVDVTAVVDLHCNVMEDTNVTGVVFALGTNLRDDLDVGAHNTTPALTGGTAPMVNPSTPGSADVSAPNNLTIVAGGTDIWDNADGFRFAYGQQTGDFDVRVRVESLIPRNRWSKAGLMVRENLTGGSRNLAAVVAPPAVPTLDGSGLGNNGYEAGKRDAQDGASTSWSTSFPTPVPYPNAWIRMRRIGDTFYAYHGSDGVNWVQYATVAAVYPSTVLLGLATTAHNNAFGQTTTAIYHDYGRILPVTIVDQPDDLTVFAGQSASFSVAVAGTAPFFYQWRHNGANLPNETNATLMIASVAGSQAGSYDVIITNMNNSVTSSVAVLTLHTDFGDVPDPTYPTLLANDGARHLIVQGFHLGASVDSELNGQPSMLADGDGSDENGIASATPFIRGQTASVGVVASASGLLDAWIDYNQDGDWADPGEQVAASAPLAAGLNTLPLPVPAAASDGPTYARLRFSSAGGLSPSGLAQDGEVEDYILLIENRPPVAVNDRAATAQDTPLDIPTSALLANDSDPNGDALTVTVVSSPTARGGTAVLAGSTVTYTPPAGFVGGDSFTYTISDGHGGTANATVCVTVGPTALQITRIDNNVVLSWPVNCESYVVEQTNSLNPGNAWSEVGGTPTVVGNAYQMSIPLAPTENRYFRLQRP